MSATAEHAYTEREQAAYEEGRAAFDAQVDYLSCPYMQPPRNLYLLCAWGEGWMSAEAESNAAA